MGRRAEEQAIIDCFVDHLDRTTGATWTSSSDEISTFKNARRYDCELTASGRRPIAAEICALFQSPNTRKWDVEQARLHSRLLTEIRERGMGGLRIRTPIVQKKHTQPSALKRTVDAICEQLRQRAIEERFDSIELDGYSIQRIGEDFDESYCLHLSTTAFDPIFGSGGSLVSLLRDKHTQLDIDHHERYLVVTNCGCPAYARDLIDACAFIDFNEYPHFDRIYFEESLGSFRLIFDQRAWRLMESGKLPYDVQGRNLVAGWIEARLGRGWPGALFCALQICSDGHGVDWLTEEGQDWLVVEAHRFLTDCEWTTPKVLWETFRGSFPLTVDVRRRVRPIAASKP